MSWRTAQTALQPGLCKVILSRSHHWERAAGFLCQFPLLWVKQTALPEPAQRLVSEQPSWKCLLSSAAMYVFHLPAAWALSVTKSCSMRKHHIYWADNPSVLTNLSSFHNRVALLLFFNNPHSQVVEVIPTGKESDVQKDTSPVHCGPALLFFKKQSCYFYIKPDSWFYLKCVSFVTIFLKRCVINQQLWMIS